MHTTRLPNFFMGSLRASNNGACFANLMKIAGYDPDPEPRDGVSSLTYVRRQARRRAVAFVFERSVGQSAAVPGHLLFHSWASEGIERCAVGRCVVGWRGTLRCGA